MPRSCDIFCNVVDNYGDIGVCWRLARQLANEYGLAVRLWVDDLNSLAKLCPEADVSLESQHCRGVEVRHWEKSFPEAQPADLVIEAFACKLPQGYLEAMAAAEPEPVWINLEYLSAEDWVETHHKLPSPQPSLPLTRYFFFPGFTPQTGGLLLERDLLVRRDAFQSDAARQRAFWEAFGVEMPGAETLKVSLFGYENEVLPGLFDAWAEGAQPVLCLVPEGRILPQVRQYFENAGRDSSQHADTGYRRGEFIRPWADKSAPTEPLPVDQMAQAIPKQAANCAGMNPDQQNYAYGRLRVRVLPFVEQERYDELLWACDVNFVRGEDSCVRAQWAANPFIWHIYPQQDGVHRQKLRAFMARYCAGLSPDAARALHGMWEAWNGGGDVGRAWNDFRAQQSMLRLRARDWAQELAANNLALNLLDFFREIGRMRAFKIEGQQT